jgi:hypothetical protein
MEPLVIPLRTPRSALGVLVAAAVGLVAWIVAAPGWESILIGGTGVVALAWSGVLVHVSRRLRGGGPRAIVATREGVSSPAWKITWDRVDRVVIRQSQAGPALVIEPLRPDDVELSPSRILGLNRRLNAATRSPQIMLPQRVLDRPLGDLVAQLEELAGRPLA